ncbi:hypothetical protein C2U70_16135 [Bradyrhizobium guangdongense]|uniref:hypothetical protein n=1 Tax=Bradyrhizobium guangdongense TaxID=1325090 RepID=UPI001125CD43|nr:hypothetical protein [Bradyrhizobium guangdongense]TPQ34875.1 hypothetical protein C2U70_16135 [Bradyrhizobium guangdongense]
MKHLTLLGAAAIAVSALATPTMAQTMRDNQVRCQSAFPNSNCETWRGSNAGAERSYDRRVSYRQARDRDNDWNRTQTGFWPADVAGNVAGAAVGTAGAIATAPFRAWDNSYAYDNSYPSDGDYRGWDSRSYAQRNGFVCTPGTTFRGEDGKRHLCQ